MEYKPLPIGVENFKQMIKDGYFYIDKTIFIKEIIDKMAVINLFTRPRRFGKSLNINMLQYYFDITKKDDAWVFDGLNIMSQNEKYLSHMNKYPVIKLSLKSAEKNNFKSSFYHIKNELRYEFNRHKYLLQSDRIGDSEKPPLTI